MDGLGGLGLAAKISGLWPKGWGDARNDEPGGGPGVDDAASGGQGGGQGGGNAYIYDENYFGPNHVTSLHNGELTEYDGDEADAAWANRDASGQPRPPGGGGYGSGSGLRWGS